MVVKDGGTVSTKGRGPQEGLGSKLIQMETGARITRPRGVLNITETPTGVKVEGRGAAQTGKVESGGVAPQVDGNLNLRAYQHR